MTPSLPPRRSLRALVSGTRRRWTDASFDLDLCYVSPRILAMSFPAVGAEGLFRNPRGEVLRFLRRRLGGHYLVCNLCAEKRHQYDPLLFAHAQAPEGAVCLPCADHCVPSMGQMAELVRRAMEWLGRDADNVVVVHCKAGKGRTGVMVAALLLALGEATDPEAALDRFALARSTLGQGVTIPSQRRWVRLFAQWWPQGDLSESVCVDSVQVSGLGPPSGQRLRLKVRIAGTGCAPGPLRWTRVGEGASSSGGLLQAYSPQPLTRDCQARLSLGKGRSLSFWICLDCPHQKLTLADCDRVVGEWGDCLVAVTLCKFN